MYLATPCTPSASSRVHRREVSTNQDDDCIRQMEDIGEVTSPDDERLNV
jgi:hypothetical protein